MSASLFKPFARGDLFLGAIYVSSLMHAWRRCGLIAARRLGFDVDEEKLAQLGLLHDGNPSGHGKYALPENLGRNEDGSWSES